MDAGQTPTPAWAPLVLGTIFAVVGAIAGAAGTAFFQRIRGRQQRAEKYDQDTYTLCKNVLMQIEGRLKTVRGLPDAIASGEDLALAGLGLPADARIRLGESATTYLEKAVETEKDMASQIERARMMAVALLRVKPGIPASVALMGALVEDLDEHGSAHGGARAAREGLSLVAHILDLVYRTGKPSSEHEETLLDLLPPGTGGESVKGLVTPFLKQVDQLRSTVSTVEKLLGWARSDIEGLMNKKAEVLYRRRKGE